MLPRLKVKPSSLKIVIHRIQCFIIEFKFNKSSVTYSDYFTTRYTRHNIIIHTVQEFGYLLSPFFKLIIYSFIGHHDNKFNTLNNILKT